MLLVGHTTLKAAVSVATILIASFVVTGTITSAYKRKRSSLGQKDYASAQSLMQRGKAGDAIEEYRKALVFSPDNTDYRLSLAIALLSAGRLEEARTHLEQLSQDDPTNGMVNLALARIAARRKNLDNAIDYYQRAVYEYWPASQLATRREARWELVGLLAKAGKRNEVVGELIQLYSSAPPDGGEKSRVGFLLLKYGATSEAAQAFRDIIRSNPQNPEPHRGLGQVYFNLGEYVSARHEFQRALKLNPKDTESEQKLALTNSVIELDAGLPGLSSSERERRSQNLLSRLLSDVQSCLGSVPLPDGLNNDLKFATKLLSGKMHPSEDQLQASADQLWKDRSVACRGAAPPATAISLAMARLSHD